MLQTVSAHELAEWVAYYKLEPFGEERADLRVAINSHVTACAAGSKNSKVENYMPFRDKPKATLHEAMRIMNALPGAKHEVKNNGN